VVRGPRLACGKTVIEEPKIHRPLTRLQRGCNSGVLEF
jgi:hypothetical protein